jgi:DNA-directed RNA polymerase subunit omega
VLQGKRQDSTHQKEISALRDDYIKEAQKVKTYPNILVNVVSRRVKQLRHGNRPLVESLEKLNLEDIALREIIEGKISYEIGEEA